VIQDELEKEPAPRGDAHPVGLQEGEEIPVPLHIARCCNSELSSVNLSWSS